MKKRTRRILFYFSILLFIILGVLVVLFALGYKYDFVQNKFLKTGSFELKLNTSAEVYINDDFAGKTSFLGDSFSKGSLLPRAYSIRIQSDQYQSWQKLIKIEEGFLTSFPRVVLLPKEFKEETIASSSTGVLTIKRFDPERKLAFAGNKQKVEAFDLKSGEKQVATQLPRQNLNQAIIPNYVSSPDGDKNTWFNEHEIWVKWLEDSNHQPFKKAGETELVARFPQKIEDVQWYKDSEHLIVGVSLSDRSSILKFVEIDNRDGINIFDISTLTEPFYYDRDMNAIFKFERNKLVKISLK